MRIWRIQQCQRFYRSHYGFIAPTLMALQNDPPKLAMISISIYKVLLFIYGTVQHMLFEMALLKKKVFVTVGTTKFDELIETVLSSEVLEALSLKGYNELILQIGKTSLAPDCTPRCGFDTIGYFNISTNILEYVQKVDLIISHAGAGSILDALENQKHLIVVTNQSLMNNHQVELAGQLYVEKHLYYCTCETLLDTIQMMDFAQLKPFVNKKCKRIAEYINQIMGFST